MSMCVISEHLDDLDYLDDLDHLCTVLSPRRSVP